MELRLLGPVEIRAADRPLDAGGPRQRTILAALAVDVGQPVMVDTAVDRAWGHELPGRVRHALYVYIARLRRVISEASTIDGTPAGLVRRSRGYVLQVDPDCVDAYRFRRLVERARNQQCPDSRRVALLRQALDLWHGAPLADLPGEWAAGVSEGLRQQRLHAVVMWAQAELRLGTPVPWSVH
jgi:DNA-binding SARP family transcriptional activator